MPDLREMGVTDDLAESVMSERRLASNLNGWNAYFDSCPDQDDSIEKDSFPSTTMSSDRKMYYTPLSADEKTGWLALFTVILIVMDFII